MEFEQKMDMLKKSWYLARELRNTLNDLALGSLPSSIQLDNLMTEIKHAMQAILFKNWCKTEGFQQHEVEISVKEKL